MQIFNRYYVGVNIQTTFVNFVVIKQSLTGITIENSVYKEFDVPLSLMPSAINEKQLINLLVEMTKNFPIACRYRIALDSSQILQQQLIVPKEIKTIQERQWFIESALNQLFPLPANELAIDYDEDHHEITITAARKQSIEQWQHIFRQAKLKLDLITIWTPEISKEGNQTPLQQIKITENLAKKSVGKVINLLPWRAERFKWKLRQTIGFTFGYLILFSLSFILIWYAKQQELQGLLVSNEQQSQYYQKQNHYFLNINQLNQRVDEMKLRQEVIEDDVFNLLILLHKLIDFSDSIPSGIWLEQLNFSSGSIFIQGHSFLYPAIILFIQHLDHQQFVNQSMIQSIQYRNELFQFRIQLSLKMKSIE